MSCSVNKFHADLHNKIEKILFSGQHFEGVAYRVKRRADIKLIFIDDKFMNVHKREYKLCSLDLFCFLSLKKLFAINFFPEQSFLANDSAEENNVATFSCALSMRFVEN